MKKRSQDEVDTLTSLRDERRLRFQAKQKRMAADSGTGENSDGLSLSTMAQAWIRQSSIRCSVVDVPRVQIIQERMSLETPSSSYQPFSSNEDVLLERLLCPYFDLYKKDIPLIDPRPDIVMDQRQRFIAEGTETIRLLIQQSQNDYEMTRGTDSIGCVVFKPIEMESVFVKPNLFFEEPVCIFKDVEKALERTSKSKPSPSAFHILLGSEATISAVAGFPVSRGCLACGFVPTYIDEDWFFRYIKTNLKGSATPLRLVVLDGISDTANLGSIIRTSSAFGIQAIVLSEDSCDAWYRRSIRVSMGHVFRVPIVRVSNLKQTLLNLECPPFHVTSYAAIAENHSKLLLNKLKPGDVPIRWCCVLGNESNGISPAVLGSCHHTIRIGMDEGVDSLSLPIATGILLHGLREKEGT